MAIITQSSIQCLGFNNTSLKDSNKFRIENYNIITDTYCSKLDKKIESSYIHLYHFLLITELWTPINYKINANNKEENIKNSIYLISEPTINSQNMIIFNIWK